MCSTAVERATQFAGFLQRHQAALLAECRRLVRPGRDPEDLLQDVLLALWQRTQRQHNPFDPCQSGALAYALQAIRWLFRSGLRGRSLPLQLEEADLVAPQVEEAWLFRAREEAREKVQEALNGLDASQRTILVLRLAGLTFQEISTAVGLPLATVYNRYRAALDHLRRVIGIDPLPE